jgi:hypothetical protein
MARRSGLPTSQTFRVTGHGARIQACTRFCSYPRIQT